MARVTTSKPNKVVVDSTTVKITAGSGIPGAQGDTGPQGPTGTAATITVGTTTTLSPGAAATVANSGTAGAAVLDFGIPQGATGAAGTAATVSVGSVTTGTAGSTAAVTNSGTSSAAVLNFTIPRGDTGATGSTGAAGPGVATGGTAGQVLSKVSGTNYDTTWTTPSVDIPQSLLDARGDLIVASAADTAARLAVGTDGYVLTADSTATNGVKWGATLPTTGVLITATTTQSMLPGVGIIGATFGYAAMAGYTGFSPIYVDKAFTVSEFHCYVSSAVAGTITFGIYNASETWVPTTKVAGPTTGVSSGSTGFKTEAITPVTLQPGRYLIAVATTAACQLWVYNAAFWGTVNIASGASGIPRAGWVNSTTMPDNPGTFTIATGGYANGSVGTTYLALLKGTFA